MAPLLALALAAYVCAAALPAGAAALRLLRVPTACQSAGERYALAAAFGLGVQAQGLTLLGLVGAFRAPPVVALPLVLALVSLPAARGWIGRERPQLSLPGAWEGRLALGLGALLAGAVLVFGLGPPTDYDGLLYHLVAPQTFLQAGRLAYIPHNFSANLPAFGEMLFAAGLAAGSDRAPQLIHGAAGALAVVVTALLGRRFLDRDSAFWGAVALAATPLVPFLSTRAYIDLFTTLFALLAFWGALEWLRSHEAGWLRLAGAGLGFALATKYAAFTTGLPLGAGLVLAVLITGPAPWSARLMAGVKVGAIFAAFVLVAALPWYARQVLLLGNPVWPMYFGGRDWAPERVAQLTYFVSQYGSGTGLGDWLRLPINVYWESWRFGHVPLSFPPLVAPAAPLALLARRWPTGWLLAVLGGVALLWARGWQDLRYLLTVYPLLALLGVLGAREVARRVRGGQRAVSLALCAALAVTAGREVWRAADRVPVVLGIEPVQAYLTRALDDHRAIAFLNERLAPTENVLFLGDGQIWYCRMRCIPDPAHDNLLVWFLGRGMAWDAAQPTSATGGAGVEAAAARLKAEGVSHVLLSKKDFWYLEHQDPADVLRRQLNEFYVFKARYLDLVYEDALTEVYRGRW